LRKHALSIFLAALFVWCLSAAVCCPPLQADGAEGRVDPAARGSAGFLMADEGEGSGSPSLGGMEAAPEDEEEADAPDTGDGSESPMLGGQEADEPDEAPGIEEPAPEEPAEEEPADPDRDVDPDRDEELESLRERVRRLEMEAEARETLRMTEEEERDEEEEILEAAGREYTLMPTGMIGLELNTRYSYYTTDVLRDIDPARIEYVANHNIDHNFVIETAIRDNLNVEAAVPFVYKYDRVATERSMDIRDLGDISVGIKYQPFKTGNRWPAPIFNTRLTFPTGRGEYDIDPENEMSTGSGLYSLSGGVSVSHPFDPVNAFASLTYRHRFNRSDIGQIRHGRTLDEVDPGDRVNFNMGFGYSVSYRMSLSLSVSYTYGLATDYYYLASDGRDKETTGDMASSSINLNTAWRLSPQQTIIVGVGAGLTSDDHDVNFSLRLPFQFDLR